MKSSRPAIAATAFCVLLSFIGCIHHVPADELATRMAATATTNPHYWLDQPAVAQIACPDYDRLWYACDRTARAYLFTLDRQDYRTGLMTTVPLVSRQMFEPWRPDTGTSQQVSENSICTIRRTLRFEITRQDDGSYIAIPKVLVERQTILERRITSVDQYHEAFEGPAAISYEAVTSDEPIDQPIPAKYWTPMRRDLEMEKQVAAKAEKILAELK